MMHSAERTQNLQAIFILGIAAGCLAYLGHWLQVELKGRRLAIGERTPVAELVSGKKTVQRKLSKEILWEDIANRQTLFNRDAIRTGSESIARIRFKDGTELELSENSLVVLDRSEDKVGIEFLKGNLFAKSGGKKGSAGVRIKTAKGSVNLGQGGGAGALSLSGQAGKDIELSVASGSATIETAEGKVKLGEHEKGQLAQSGVAKQKLKLWTELPVLNARFIGRRSDAQALVPFRWGGQAFAELQVAKDSDFKKLVAVKKGQSQQKLKLTPGDYFWRVVTKEGRRILEQSDTAHFVVLEHRPVRLEAPENRGLFQYFKSVPLYEFVWKVFGEPQTDQYRVEISTDRKFKDAIVPPGVKLKANALAKGIKGSVIADRLPSNQNYFWRVVTTYQGMGARGKGQVEIPSQVNQFRVSQAGRLPTPTLLDPAPRASIGLTRQKSLVEFRWSPIIEAKSYRLRVAADARFRKVLVDQSVTRPEWKGVIKENGRLYWTVVAQEEKSPGEKDSKPAKARSLQLTRADSFKLILPRDQQKIEYLTRRPSVQFKWERVAGTRFYEIQIADDPEFKKLVFQKRTNGSRINALKIPEGVRYWRVSAMGTKGLVLALSRVHRYELGQKPALQSVDKKLPAAGTKVKISGARVMQFDWNPVAGAMGYQVSLQKQDSGGKFQKIWSRTTKKNQLAKKLPSGVYRWEVRAIDQAKRLGERSPARQFELYQPDVLVGPVIQKPSFNSVFKSNDPKKIKLAWEKVEGAQSYQVSVFKVDSGKKELFLRGKTTDLDFEVPESIRSGKYQWSVAAIGAPPGSKKKTRRGENSESTFSVNWIGVLRAPSGVHVVVEEDD